MLHIGQRVRVWSSAPAQPQFRKYRGEVGTIDGLNVAEKLVGPEYATLEEFPGIVFPHMFLIPIDDDHDEAFDRFMKKLDLGNPSFSPWTEGAT